MFGRKDNDKKALVTNANSALTPVKIDYSIDLLNKMRDTQVISNYEYMMLALQLQILEKLTSIDINLAKIDISTQFVGKFVSNKFSWV